MDELLELTRKNYEMLKRICAYIDKVDSAEYKAARKVEASLSNVAADLLVDNNQRQARFGRNIQQ